MIKHFLFIKSIFIAMKKILISIFSLISFHSFGQSVTINPLALSRNGGNSNDFSIIKSSSDFPTIVGYRSGGSQTSPTNTILGMDLLLIGAGGHANGSFTGRRSQIRFQSTQDWDAFSQGTKMTFSTTANGSTATNERMVINHDGNVGIGLISPDKILDINGRMRIRHTPGFTAGVWMSNSTNGLTDADGAFFGLENDNKAGIWINNAWRFGVNNSGEISTSSMVGSGSRMVLASPTGVLFANNQPQVWSIIAGAFSSETSSSANFIKGSNIAYFTSGNTGAMFAPVNLPTGVTVTEVKVFYQDNSANSMTISLREQNLQNDNAGGTTLGSVGTFTSTNVTGIQSANLTLSGATTIDNANRAYYLEAASSNWSGLRIHSFKITYSY
jgi:hypothetical protein